MYLKDNFSWLSNIPVLIAPMNYFVIPVIFQFFTAVNNVMVNIFVVKSMSIF